jgi:hypothetical protein
MRVETALDGRAGDGRVWAWVSYDGETAYMASVEDGVRPVRPLMGFDWVERVRVDCEAAAAAGAVTDLLVWEQPGVLVELSGQWDEHGNPLEPGGKPMRTRVEHNGDGLFWIGDGWAWRQVEHACGKCAKVLHLVGDDWSASDGTACGADVGRDSNGDPVIGHHEVR